MYFLSGGLFKRVESGTGQGIHFFCKKHKKLKTFMQTVRYSV